jgi:hypothetical protein
LLRRSAIDGERTAHADTASAATRAATSRLVMRVRVTATSNPREGRARAVNDPGCGGASACLSERIPVTRRDHQATHQNVCPCGIRENARKSGSGADSLVLSRGRD